MTSRRFEVFFYGLFMDEELLRAKGLSPGKPELAYVDGLELRIGRRAALAPSPAARVHGVVMSLTAEELDRLYADPGVREYRPQPVLACLAGGGKVAALCYNLAEPPPPSERNAEYVEKLRSTAAKVGLPADYVASLR